MDCCEEKCQILWDFLRGERINQLLVSLLILGAVVLANYHMDLLVHWPGSAFILRARKIRDTVHLM